MGQLRKLKYPMLPSVAEFCRTGTIAMKFKEPTVHIAREGYGKQPGLCGTNPRIMVHGGPATATCLRCLTSKVGREWINNTTDSQSRKFVQWNLKRLGLSWPS
jgi:hypothetical protein